MALLEVKELTVTFPDAEQPVLNHISLSIEKGEKVLILGASGSGKSTLALALNGMIPYAIDAHVNGSIILDGIPMEKLGTAGATQQIGMLFQDPETQFCMLNVDEEVAFGLENMRVQQKQMTPIIQSSLEQVGLQQYVDDSVNKLSGGMKQKLGIASLIAMNRKIWVLDEPTANLDPKSAEEVLQLVLSLNENENNSEMTLICIEHRLDLFAPYMDRVIVLGDQGEVLLDSPPRELFSQHAQLLQKEGIWMPHICTAAAQLEGKGKVWHPFPLTLEEWMAQMGSLPESAVTPESSGNLDSPGHPKNSNSIESSDSPASPEFPEQHDSVPLLAFNQVGFAYEEKHILTNLNFELQKGEFMAIVGANGAGKSTLSQLMMRLIQPSSGRIFLEGSEMSQLTSAQIYQRFGYVFQNPEHQFIRDTVFEELSYGFELLGKDKADWQPKVHALLTQFGLETQRHSHPYQLSQGQKRRLSVATMLTFDQDLLILDEPTFGQDQAYTTAMMELLCELHAKGKTIVMITHDMELIYQYVKRVLWVEDEGISFDGETNTFFNTLQKTLQQKMESGATSPLNLPVQYQLQTSIDTFLKEISHA